MGGDIVAFPSFLPFLHYPPFFPSFFPSFFLSFLNSLNSILPSSGVRKARKEGKEGRKARKEDSEGRGKRKEKPLYPLPLLVLLQKKEG
jgi:hypothetical protein